MSDRMNTLPFDKLILWVLNEYEKEKSVFGIPDHKFYKKSDSNSLSELKGSLQSDHLSLFGRQLESPLGPAAGPNTQLAQNIIAAYVAGGRFFELKTVQVIDGEDLPVSKPCILARDEGYNVEWSTELTVSDALNEYIKAWFALNLLSKEFALGSTDGFIFNMSVGYDLEGIKSPKINEFIDGLKDSSRTRIWKECKDFLLHNLSLWKGIDKEYIEEISPRICESITLSTLHGCPPEEIERIAVYLMEEKGLHTYIKCNPTLLGYEFCRQTLDHMGYDYLSFDDHHFKNDLQFEEAVPMIARLQALANKLDLTFGVKLTNTFPVKIKNKELPGEEMYLSGKPLYPLTINLAYKLAKAYDGNLRISYSGGADIFNIDQIYQAGIWPITLATTILKPGGYARMKQLAELLEEESQVNPVMLPGFTKIKSEGSNAPIIEGLELVGKAVDSKELESKVVESKVESKEVEGIEVEGIEVEAAETKRIALEKLCQFAKDAISDTHYRKHLPQQWNRKLKDKVPLVDCFLAPCNKGCPINQDIPEYLRLVDEERYLEALEVITAKNPLPFITGTLCNHPCMAKCTRQDYEEAVDIRGTKLLAAQKGFKDLISKLEPSDLNSDCKVAVIGGGPAGLAGAYFLRKSGIDVTVFEKRDEIGGVIKHIAPGFRISEEAIDNDMELIRKTGVKFCLGVDERFSIEGLKREGFKYIFIAIGAEKPGRLELDECDAETWNVLEFLETYHKNPEALSLGKSVAVIGAGNSAMDAARAAIRVPGVESVAVVYRRTKEYMPAAKEELELAFKDGVELKELLAPILYSQGILHCQKMELGAPDASGRRSPIPDSGQVEKLRVDSVIAAVGERVETELFLQNNIEVDDKGKILVNSETNETSIENVFVGGDTLRGPATIVEGIADGTKVARIILEREKDQRLKLEKAVSFHTMQQMDEIQRKKAILQHASSQGQGDKRCLECNIICNLCAEVCPNRANLAVPVITEELKCKNQIIHMDGMCNECGNCETFCPYDSAPYRDKLTLYWKQEDFEDSNNAGFILLNRAENHFKLRLEHTVEDVIFDASGVCSAKIPKGIADVIWSVYIDSPYIFQETES
jgi:putative selenate reductase